MRYWLLALAIVIGGCTSFASVGYVDLPDGSKLKAVKYQSDTAIGTDINYGMVMQCVQLGEAGSRCTKVGEFGGASASFLKTLFHGGAAGAAIGTGLALQDESIYAEGGDASATQSQGQGQFQFQQQQQKQSVKQKTTVTVTGDDGKKK